MKNILPNLSGGSFIWEIFVTSYDRILWHDILPVTHHAPSHMARIDVVSLMCIFANCLCLACIVFILCVFVVSYVYLFYYVCIAALTLDAGLLARSQYPEGPETGHLDTGFSWFPCVYKRMLRWFPSFQVATTCLSCSPPDLNFLATFLSYLCTCKLTTATGW
jgi:hypothetical protein